MTNYAEKYFGKDLEELEYADISNFFIESKEESDKIEFKAFHPDYGNFNQNLDGVIRGICGFLNSNGGILIWGAPLGKKEDGKIVFVGDLAPVKEFKEKDTLISKISDSITPLPVNINVQIIENDGSYLYIFEIQQSNYSPHQFKNTYYARLDGQTKPAPHYLIDALFKKVNYPNIEGFINLDRYGNAGNGNMFLDISILIINFSELQNEQDISYRVICGQAVFAGSLNARTERFYSMEGHQYTNRNHIDILHFGGPEMNSQRLIFNMETLGDEHNYEMDIVLFFGGKKSPLKFSEYKLNFGGSISAKNPVGLISNLEENVLASEKQKALGTTRENLLESLLKR
ncbi:ATP-binding protein [Cellulophaga sp. HaHaR_3_176]|uniref:ATP-binding protein n=1 Tax=Cellulophaga sp. HaHaR_3_176 TaxID=1942464 RepID=UPI001C1F4B3F|nr:ATP-binding protein [Cellulophaga sp. HaHaR_3_176]QWX84860.1 ATP-binding protein [Cellulophaga sp. HaHaR_3_176]